jgi:hypothetical protein
MIDIDMDMCKRQKRKEEKALLRESLTNKSHSHACLLDLAGSEGIHFVCIFACLRGLIDPFNPPHLRPTYEPAVLYYTIAHRANPTALISKSKHQVLINSIPTLTSLSACVPSLKHKHSQLTRMALQPLAAL